MPDSVYRVTEVIGVSSESWEAAARSAVETAANTVRDLRVAEVVRQDVVLEEGQVTGFRVRLAISVRGRHVGFFGDRARAASGDGGEWSGRADGVIAGASAAGQRAGRSHSA